jgi:HEAT repeat protein
MVSSILLSLLVLGAPAPSAAPTEEADAIVAPVQAPADDLDPVTDEDDDVQIAQLVDSGERAQEARERQQEREQQRREHEQEAREREQEARERAQESDERLEELYNDAQEQIDDGQWDQAVRTLDQLARAKPGTKADAALYWKAYALNKRGQRAEALATLAELKKAYPQSAWLGDAKALEVEMHGGTAASRGGTEELGDEETKLLVINSLMQSDPERALPVLEKLLATSTSPRIRERALFVLCQSDSPQAREIVSKVARGGRPDLQQKAIKYLGLFGGAESRQALSDIYAASSDVGIKRSILQAFMVSGEKGRLLQAAKSEPVPELRRAAIEQLGVMGAHAELAQLYASETAPELRRALIQAFFVGGDFDRMAELARTERDPELRKTAIRNLGLMGGPRAGEVLVSLYDSEKDRELRKQTVEALFLQSNAKALVTIARKESDPELRREIVARLSQMGGKDATDFMLEILNK